jgi:uncharacterized protein YabE (DUF348 family)
LNRRPVVLAVFVSLAILMGLAINASGFSFTGRPKTRVEIVYGSQKLDFFSTQKNLKDALLEKGIKLAPQDKPNLALETELSGKAVKGAIDKALPVVIMDGYTRTIGRSTSTAPAVVLADNGFKIAPEDKVASQLILDPVSAGGAGLMVQIDRAPVYYVLIDDKNIPVRSWDPNVGVIVGASKANINPQDEISRAKTDAMLPGDTVVVTRINEVDIPVLSTVEFETKNTTSTAVAFGQSQVTQAGVNGQVKKTYHVVYKNGVEVSRWLISTVITVPVQHKIVARGVINGRANFGYYDGMVTSFYKGMTGHHLLVTNLANGKQVTVRIIGSGPFNGPLMDMGTEPFKAIGGSLSTGYLPSVSVSLID